jgi:AbrB family looped-hinge helix DNA binding protein
MTQKSPARQLQFEYTKASSKGQVVIPRKIRKKLRISEGSLFAVAAQDDTILLKKMTQVISHKDLKTIKLLEEAWEDIENGRYKIRSKESFLRELATW